MHEAFSLDPAITFLNHGSFGACPREVQAYQAELRARLEAEPVRFLTRELEPLLDEALAAVARFVGARPEDLAFVPNATTGVNAVLRSLTLSPGDELLFTSHGYNACGNVARTVTERQSAVLVVADVPFPTPGPEAVVDAVLARVTPHTRVALLDHVTSPTGLVWPIAALVQALEARGVMVLVDAAHSAGQVPLALDALGASFTTGNLHKWTCAPKGSAFLHVRRDRQALVRPHVISHGANSPRADKSRFRLEFDWLGTLDPTAWLATPRALEVMARLFGGWDAIRAANHALAVEARRTLLAALGTPAPAPEDMLGAMASVVLPEPATGPGALPGTNVMDPLQDRLFHEHGIEVPVFTFAGRRVLRVSAQRYNALTEYEKLARILPGLL